MRRLKDQKEQELNNEFKRKLPLASFKKKQQNLSDYLDTIHPKEKRKGGDGEQAYSEISTLLNLGVHYKASYLKWTGEQQEGNSCDGVLYFDQDEQKIEISALINPEEMKDYRAKGKHQEMTKSIVLSMKEMNMSENDIREYWESYNNVEKHIMRYPVVIVEDFIYERLVDIFKKKNKKKYKGFWLVISYEPIFALEYFSDDRIKQYIFNKIKSRHDFSQLKDIFKKIIFLPYHEVKGHKISELDKSYFEDREKRQIIGSVSGIGC